jgi:hypothetical protein
MNNSTTNFTGHYGMPAQINLIIATNIALFVLGITAILGNGFILVVIARYQKLRNNLCNLLIAILAIADIGSGE